MKYIAYILTALLLIACGIILWMYFNPKYEQVYVKVKPTPEIVYIERGEGAPIATIEKQIANSPVETLSENYASYVNDTLVPALNKGLKYKAEVTELNRINARLKDSLTKKNMVINAAKTDVMHWQTKYIAIAANTKDSTVTYAYNAQIDVMEYEKKETLFGAKKSYIAVTSPDENFKINGMENYTKELKRKKDFLKLNGKIQGFYLNETITPYGGLELILLPDNRISPNISAGYFYHGSSGKMYQFFSGGIQFNVFKF